MSTKQAVIICSLVFIILACSIVSTKLHPKNVEKYLDNQNDDLFLLIKTYAYDRYALQHFYSFPRSDGYTYEKPITPRFFAIAKKCSKAGLAAQLECYDYNLNAISLENKSQLGLNTCASIDMVLQSNNSLAHLIQIGEDMFTLHKNCLTSSIDFQLQDCIDDGNVSTNTCIPNPIDVRSIVNTDDYSPENIDNQIAITNPTDTKRLALLLSDKYLNVNDKEATLVYVVKVSEINLCHFLVLNKPLFVRIGMSGLYRVLYVEITAETENYINDYASYMFDGVLNLKLNKVCDSKLFDANLPNLSDAMRFNAIDDINVDCKSSSSLQPSSSPTTNKFKNNMMVYYLSYKETVNDSSNLKSNAITLYFSNITFTSNYATLFDYDLVGNIMAYSQNETNYVTLNIGRVRKNIGIPSINTTHFKMLITWSLNKVSVAIFFQLGGEKRLKFITYRTENSCSVPKDSFNSYCVAQNVNIFGKTSTCLISMYDFAKSKNLI